VCDAHESEDLPLPVPVPARLFGDLEGGSAVEDETVSGLDAGPALRAGVLARRLGVAATTLRTWHQRYGLGPSRHESGQHRRYTEHDIAVLTEMARLTAHGVPAGEAARLARLVAASAPAEHPIAGVGADAAARGLARAARRLDALTVRTTLADAVAEHGVVHTWHVLAGPAFTHLARGHHAEPEKAVARRILGRAVSEVLAAMPRPPAGSPTPVLLVAVDNGRDVIGLDAVAAALAERGIGSLHLGAGLPHPMLADVVARRHPVAVVAWGHAWHHAMPGLVAALTGVPGWRPALVVTGQGWPPHADLMVRPTLADVVAEVAGLIS
jgi:MerR family transcriptional regulator, light-induced transcriptional regulator